MRTRQLLRACAPALTLQCQRNGQKSSFSQADVLGDEPEGTWESRLSTRHLKAAPLPDTLMSHARPAGGTAVKCISVSGIASLCICKGPYMRICQAWRRSTCRLHATEGLACQERRTRGAIQELDDGHPGMQDRLDVSSTGIVPPQQLHHSLRPSGKPQGCISTAQATGSPTYLMPPYLQIHIPYFT